MAEADFYTMIDLIIVFRLCRLFTFTLIETNYNGFYVSRFPICLEDMVKLIPDQRTTFNK